MDLITREMVNELSQIKDERSISIYMPTHRVGREMQKDPIQLKNLLSSAEQELASREFRKPEIDEMLEPVKALLVSGRFWEHQSDGLAIFIAEDFFRYFRLPIYFSSMVFTGKQLHLKPLISMLSGDGQFYILALSQNQIRLLHGTRFSVDNINLENVPTSLKQALYDDDPERQLQFRTGMGSQTSGGRQVSMFHGHSVADENNKKNLLRYFQQVDKGLMDLLEGEHIPLILAGVDYLLPIYKEASRYQNLIEETIQGNPDDLSSSALHKAAWQIMRPIFESDQNEAVEKFKNLYGSKSEDASVNVEDVIIAAHWGRVETLFVPLSVHLWGIFEAKRNKLVLHKQEQPGDQDLLDLAAVQTIVNGGMVYVLEQEEVPEKAKLAAIFRYSFNE
jgi:hypothetical protein